MYGQALKKIKSAYISDYQGEYWGFDSEGYLERLIKTAVHEVGHVFGLEDHIERQTGEGKLCIMVDPALRRNITLFQAFTSVDYHFCEECCKRLGSQEFKSS